MRAADSVNHAIISRGELETGFSRLVAAGYATVSSSGYLPSDGIREFWEKKTKSWGSLYKSWEQLGKHIGAEAMRSGPLPTTESEQYVSKAAYEAEVAAYALNTPHPLLGKK